MCWIWLASFLLIPRYHVKLWTSNDLNATVNQNEGAGGSHSPAGAPMTVDRMTAPPSSTQLKLHLQPHPLPTLSVCYCQPKPKKTVLQFPSSKKTNCFNFLVIIYPYTWMRPWPHSSRSHSIFKGNVFWKCNPRARRWGIFPHHVIIPALDSSVMPQKTSFCLIMRL